MWVREKIRAEKSLFDFADGSNLRVIAYQPNCGAGDRNWSRNLGSNSARSGLILANVVKISTSGIIRYSEAYERRYAVHSSHRSLAPLQKQCRGDNK